MAITINGNGTVTGISVGGLPDGIVDTDMLAANAVTAAKAAGSVKGITEMDQWRLTTNVTVSASGGFLTSDWERNDTNFSKIGTGMTESSGVFTFPSTGIWQIHFNGLSSDTDANRYSGIEVHLSTNGGGSFVAIHESWQAIPDQSSETVYGSFNANTIVDVTNVTGGSDFQVKFFANGHNEILLSGSTAVLRTNVTFIRLGDT